MCLPQTARHTAHFPLAPMSQPCELVVISSPFPLFFHKYDKETLHNCLVFSCEILFQYLKSTTLTYMKINYKNHSIILYSVLILFNWHSLNTLQIQLSVTIPQWDPNFKPFTLVVIPLIDPLLVLSRVYPRLKFTQQTRSRTGGWHLKAARH